MTKKIVHLFYSILLSAVIVLSGICLIAACVVLYDFQAGSFSRESVALAFDGIKLPIYSCLALVIGGFVMDAFSDSEAKKKLPPKQYRAILKNLRRKLDISKCEPKLTRAIRAKRIWRIVFQIITLSALVFCSFFFLLYCLIGKHFPADANIGVLQAMPVFFMCLAIPFCWAVFTVCFGRFLMRKEIELVKQALSGGAKADSEPPKKVRKQTGVYIARYSILAIAVLVLIVGFCLGGTADVLAKAAAICTECVGLG